MYDRFVARRAGEALSDTPVVLIVGPRRAGKTTLVRKMEDARRTYITLDDQTTLDAAQSDPAGFIRGLDRAIIDEIQRAPELLLAIKKTVDEDNRPGRFLLGSAPAISKFKTGRPVLSTCLITGSTRNATSPSTSLRRCPRCSPNDMPCISARQGLSA